jgi:hypothetical protein
VSRAAVLAAAAGVGIGGVIPLPGSSGWSAIRVDDETRVAAEGTIAGSGARQTCVVPVVTGEAAERAREAQRAFESTRRAFEREWGVEPQSPPDWDAESAYDALVEAIEALGPFTYLVDCTFHPCVASVVVESEVEPATIAAALGLPSERVSSRSMDRGGTELFVVLLSDAPPFQTGSAEARWIENRQGQLLIEQYERLDRLP